LFFCLFGWPFCRIFCFFINNWARDARYLMLFNESGLRKAHYRTFVCLALSCRFLPYSLYLAWVYLMMSGSSNGILFLIRPFFCVKRISLRNPFVSQTNREDAQFLNLQRGNNMADYVHCTVQPNEKGWISRTLGVSLFSSSIAYRIWKLDSTVVYRYVCTPKICRPWKYKRNTARHAAPSS
jgi:hypothetical protein